MLATLLLSDGAQRAAPPRDLPPQVAARRLAAENIPLYTFTFGKSGGSERADLSVERSRDERNDLHGDADGSSRTATADGYANQRVKVQLLWETAEGMEVVDTDAGRYGRGRRRGADCAALHAAQGRASTR